LRIVWRRQFDEFAPRAEDFNEALGLLLWEIYMIADQGPSLPDRGLSLVPMFKTRRGTGAIAIPQHPAAQTFGGEKNSAENANRRPSGDHTA
jgi:hypothetical protein